MVKVSRSEIRNISLVVLLCEKLYKVHVDINYQHGYHRTVHV